MRHELELDAWLKSSIIDEHTKDELLGIKDNCEEVRDRFCTYLEFGTAGLRGIVGAGTNRMNRYTVGRATQGLADYISTFGQEYKKRGIVIAYDTRRNSEEFALETALVMAGNGIKAYLFEGIRPTPELSFAVRHLNAAAGVMITASHNPPEYNGYKVYWEDGGQITPARAKDITAMIDRITDFSRVKAADRQTAMCKGLLEYIGPEVDGEYISRVTALSLNGEMIKKNGHNVEIVYTPLHGTGSVLMGTVLATAGYNRVKTVEEQAVQDPCFSTVRTPNPEEREALQMGIEYAMTTGADIVIGTDPDCDRVGVAVRDREGDYRVLTGNQIGALLVEYVLSQRQRLGLSSPNDVIIKTIVTSEIGRAIAGSYGVQTVDTLTGFKYIGEKIEEYSRNGSKTFVLGYEESNGYLAGSFVRDKDGVIATLLLCEMALYYKLKNMTLIDVLESIYGRYGYYCERTKSVKLEGEEGLRKIKAIMRHLRSSTDEMNSIFDNKIVEFRDYLSGKIFHLQEGTHTGTGLPKSDVLYYKLLDESWLCVRPSGTEPKIKFYFAAKGAGKEDAEQKQKVMEQRLMNQLEVL